ncbi:MAG TPA: cupin domain-containing protein [Acidimicrobiia bacterium]|nr:cupin domain-containing protein [Acidimicrobiia bacterium]
MSEAFDLASTYVHLGLGATAEPLPDFEFSPEYLSAYGARTEADGDDGRLVLYDRQDASWTTWERHPAGEEVVVLVSGRVDLLQEIDGEVHTVELTPGMAVINPRNVWHTADVHEPGQALFITPGRGTENRPR